MTELRDIGATFAECTQIVQLVLLSEQWMTATRLKRRVQRMRGLTTAAVHSPETRQAFALAMLSLHDSGQIEQHPSHKCRWSLSRKTRSKMQMSPVIGAVA